MRFLIKLLLWAAIVGAGLYPAYPLLKADPSVLADPAKHLLEYYGKTATLFLIGVLTLSPLSILFPKSTLLRHFNRHRRLIGVSSFFFALVHFGFYLVYTSGSGAFFEDIGKPFLLSGAAAFFLLSVLAVTSTNRAVRKMGGRKWKRLHRLVYLAVFFIIFHQALQEKTGTVQTVYFFAPLAILQLLRLGRIFFWPPIIARKSSKSMR